MSQRSTLRVGLVGAAAGSLEIICTYPLEFAKTQLQLEHGAATTHTGFKHGTADCLARTVQQNGLKGLYRGATPWLLFSGPRSALRFATFEHFRGASKRCGAPLGDFACGLLAGSVEACFFQTPMQAIQIKLVHDASPAVLQKRFAGLGFFGTCLKIAQADGFWQGFYCGVGPAVAKGAVTNGVRFFGYHGIVSRLAGPDAKPSVSLSMLAGGLAGAVSAVISQPIGTNVYVSVSRFSPAYIALCSRRYCESKHDGLGRRPLRLLLSVCEIHCCCGRVLRLVEWRCPEDWPSFPRGWAPIYTLRTII